MSRVLLVVVGVVMAGVLMIAGLMWLVVPRATVIAAEPAVVGPVPAVLASPPAVLPPAATPLLIVDGQPAAVFAPPVRVFHPYRVEFVAGVDPSIPES